MLAIFYPSFFLTSQPAQTFPDPACTACRLQRSHPHGQHDFQAAWLGRRNESWDTYGYPLVNQHFAMENHHFQWVNLTINGNFQ